jgi:hypothetical protein
MHRIAAPLRQMRHRRFVNALVRYAERVDGGAGARALALEPGHDTRSQAEGGLQADQPATLRIVAIRQKMLHRHLGEIGIAVIDLAVGIGEFHRLGDQMDEVGPGRIQRADIHALRIARLCSRTGPWPQGPVLATLQP